MEHPGAALTHVTQHYIDVLSTLRLLGGRLAKHQGDARVKELLSINDRAVAFMEMQLRELGRVALRQAGPEAGPVEEPPRPAAMH